jgi:hypothetical protein
LINHTYTHTHTYTQTCSGRDVALSDNQSPAIKFYNVTYPDYIERTKTYQGPLYNVRGMQLWNDWNTQAKEYAISHPNEVEYLMMRTEDLMVGSSTKRYECLLALSNFVGSHRTKEEICCQSRRDVKDHGKSTIHTEDTNNVGLINHNAHNKYMTPSTRQEIEQIKKNADAAVASAERLLQFFSHNPDHSMFAKDGQFDPNQVLAMIQQTKEKADKLNPEDYEYASVNDADTGGVESDTTGGMSGSVQSVKKRYGKWEGILANNTELATHLYKEGEVGLKVFGYCPYRDIQYLSSTTSTIIDDFVCDDTVSCA